MGCKTYQFVIENKKEYNKNEKSVRINNSESETNPLTILKIRFARGEINRQEFEEMRKLLE